MSATVGKRFLGHFLTLLVARVPKSAFGHSGTSLQYGANYIGGQDPTTKLKYHLQVIAVNSPNPEKDADDLLRECPDYTTAPTAAQLKGSEEYVVVGRCPAPVLLDSANRLTSVRFACGDDRKE